MPGPDRRRTGLSAVGRPLRPRKEIRERKPWLTGRFMRRDSASTRLSMQHQNGAVRSEGEFRRAEHKLLHAAQSGCLTKRPLDCARAVTLMRIPALSDTCSDGCRTVVGAKRRAGPRHRKVSDRSQAHGLCFVPSEPRPRGDEWDRWRPLNVRSNLPEIKRAGGRAFEPQLAPSCGRSLAAPDRDRDWVKTGDWDLSVELHGSRGG